MSFGKFYIKIEILANPSKIEIPAKNRRAFADSIVDDYWAISRRVNWREGIGVRPSTGHFEYGIGARDSGFPLRGTGDPVPLISGFSAFLAVSAFPALDKGLTPRDKVTRDILCPCEGTGMGEKIESARDALPLPSVSRRSSIEHLLSELRRIDSLIQSSVRRARENHRQDDLQGLYISEQEVDDLMAQPAGLPRWATDHQDQSLCDVTAACAEQPEPASSRLRLYELARFFGLTAFDLDAVLICLAPEIDLRYERLYAYLQDDVTKKRPSVDLILNLLCRSLQEKIGAHCRFAPSAPLLSGQVLSLFEDPANPRPPLLAKCVKLDERIAAYLLGSDELDSRLKACARILYAERRLADLVLPKGFPERLQALASQLKIEDGTVLYLQGVPGVGRTALAEAFCTERGLRLLWVDAESMLASSGAEFSNVLRCAMREATLRDGAIFFDGFEALCAPEHKFALRALFDEFRNSRILAFLAGAAEWEPEVAPQFRFIRVELPMPAYAERLQIWQRVHGPNRNVDFAALAGKFRLSAGQIRAAAATAAQMALWRLPSDPVPGTAEFHYACRLHSNRKLSTLARKITPHYCWIDIILPHDRVQRLKEICATFRQRPTVYEEWGFGAKLSLGKGLNVLFSGPSGTGKTMAAEILAGELELDLYKIDLSTVVSKYIGETEKNLARIFAEATSSNAILFFDEADALFGKRSEVHDAHDRYANIEINYLLQQMEEYEGVAILATNLRGNMDEAFLRRMHFAVEFPFPNKVERRRIWERVWPSAVPRNQDLDLDFLSESFELAGGNIRNIALNAAFFAADDGGQVNMRHLIRATWRECQKIGTIIGEDEFGEYRSMLEG